jgi:hypothetical protein
VAALVAPRPLLITNSDKDGIFPLDGVARLHRKVRDIYRLHGKDNHLGLQISEGPHKDTQELQIAAFHWFNRFLKNEDPQIEMAATKFFEPEELKVFQELPADQRNTTIHDTFVPRAVMPVPADAKQWAGQRDAMMTVLKEKVFRGWPSEPGKLELKPAFTAAHDGVQLAAYDFTSQEPFRLRLYVAHREGLKDFDLVVLNALDEPGWTSFAAMMGSGFGETLRVPLAEARNAEERKEGELKFRRADLEVARNDLDLRLGQGAGAEELRRLRQSVETLQKDVDRLTLEHVELRRRRAHLDDPIAAVTAIEETDRKALESTQKMFKNFKWAMAYVAPRGIGPTAWNPSERKQTQIRRRFMLLGQTLDGMRVLDVHRAAEALRGVDGFKATPLWLQGHRQMAGIALYASLFTPDVKRIDLHELPKTHQEGPDFLNVQRFLDLPQALALAAERSPVRIYQEAAGWSYPQAVAKTLEWGDKQLVFRPGR